MKNYQKFITCTLLLSSLFSISYAQKATTTNTDKTNLQDTILLLNGDVIISKIQSISPEEIRIVKPSNKNKETSIDMDRVFSVKYSNGSEKIFYHQDTTIENYFTVEETRLFIFGEQDAAKAFKSPLSTATSFAIGTVSGSFGSLLSVVPPVVYSFVAAAPKVRIKHNTVSNPDYLKYDTYILGYERVARKKKTMNAFKGGFIGLVAGFVVYSQFIRTPPLIR